MIFFFKITKSIVLSVWIVIGSITFLEGQSLQVKNFSLPAASALTKVGFHKLIQKDGSEIPLVLSVPVSGLSLTADILLKSEAGYIRVILLDSKNNEYLVFETNTLLASDNKFSIKDFCEETREMGNIEPSTLRVELADAEISINEINYTKASSNKARALNQVVRPDKAQVQDKIDRINAQIKKKGLHWIAGKTNVSEMSYTEKKRLFRGELPNLFGFEFYTAGIFEIPSANEGVQKASTSTNSPFAPEFSWQNRHGQDWTTSPKDQDICGSCWAFAVTGATEQMVNLYYNRHLDLDLSEQQIVSCSGAGDCKGGMPIDALKYIISSGIINESCFPYGSWDIPCNYACPVPNERIKIGGYGELSSYDQEDTLKAALYRGALTSGYQSWGHAMSLVGYKTVRAGDTIDLNQVIGPDDPLIGRVAWCFKNSWGNFGYKGFVYIVADIINIDYSFLLLGPVTSLQYTDADILCVDADGDGYYTWGTGPKPAHCPSCPDLPDGDDSNSNLGPMDKFGYCKNLGPNHPPIAEAGTDRYIIYPLQKFFRLDGSGSSDPDKEHLDYSWVQTLGPACTIENASSMQPSVTIMSRGIYKFELTVSDGGYTSKDYVIINVRLANNVALNKPAIASSVESPAVDSKYVNDGSDDTRWSSVVLDSQYIQIDLLKSYSIKKMKLKWGNDAAFMYDITVSNDPSEWNYNTAGYKLENETESQDIFTDQEGRYVSILGILRDSGTKFSIKEFEVYGVIDENLPPVAHAGNDIELYIPDELFIIDGGSSSDPNNDYLLYSWKQISGPSCSITPGNKGLATITSPNFIPGIYAFELTVSDGLLSSKDTMLVTLKQYANIALNKPVVVSSVESSNYSCSKVNDGDLKTRWSSAFSDPQYVQINLGRNYRINKVVLKWEAASAKKYQIQVSNNGTQWKTISSESNGDGGTDIINIYWPLNAAYIRLYGETRNTPYGYSLYEFEVYGSPEENLPPVIDIFQKDNSFFTPMSYFSIYYFSYDPNGYDLLVSNWKQISGPSCTMSLEWNYGDYLSVSNFSAGDYVFELTASDGLLSTSDRASVTVDNLAYIKPSLSSSNQGSSVSSNMNDGNTTSFWTSDASDPQWVQVDLQKNYILKNVVLKWGTTYAKSYRIETSPDGTTWKSIFSNTTGKGGLEDLKVAGAGRYVRMYGISRSSSAGYSLAEFEVFGIEDKAAPIGSIVTFKAVVNNKYVCADNYGNNPLIANRTTAGTWEKFKVVDAGNGNIALQALINSKYVTAENYGNNPLIARATEAKTWESYQWVNNIDGTMSLKALINGKYVTAENNGNNPLIAKSGTIGNCEKFNFNIVVASAPFGPTEIGPETETAPDISVYPNPANGILHIDLGMVEGITEISIYSIDGRLLFNTLTTEASNELNIDALDVYGMVLIKVSNADLTTTLKVIIQK
jgi:hypothetical protein